MPWSSRLWPACSGECTLLREDAELLSTASRLRTDGHRSTEVGRHCWDGQGKLQQVVLLHSPPGMETPQLHWATCPSVKSSSHQNEFFLHSDGVFWVCAEMVKVNAQGTGKLKTGTTLKKKFKYPKSWCAKDKLGSSSLLKLFPQLLQHF